MQGLSVLDRRVLQTVLDVEKEGGALAVKVGYALQIWSAEAGHMTDKKSIILNLHIGAKQVPRQQVEKQQTSVNGAVFVGVLGVVRVVFTPHTLNMGARQSGV